MTVTKNQDRIHRFPKVDTPHITGYSAILMKHKLSILSAILLLASLACSLPALLSSGDPTPIPRLDDILLPTPIPSATPIPTPEPGARIDSGDQAFWNGDWDRAIQEYNSALEDNTDPEIKAAALLGLGRTYFEDGNYNRALELLSSALIAYPESTHRAATFFAQGQVYEAMEQPRQAAEAFQEFLNHRPGLIDFYIYERIGDNYYAIGEHQNAINAYNSALGSPYLGDGLAINIKIGDAYYDMGDYQTAQITYLDTFNRTGNDFVKAQMKVAMGNAYLALGETQQGYAEYRFAVENYPVSYDSYLALVELVNAGVPVSELDRGLVDYFAGQWGYAVDAFDRYINANPDNHSDAAHYYKGLALRVLGDYDGAIAELQQVIDDHINERFWVEAYDEIAYTQQFYQNNLEKASQTYVDFVDRAPQHSLAPEFLYYAARIEERNGNLNRAANLWEQIGTQFSTSDWAYDGLFQAGIARYRSRDYQIAIGHFQSALGVAGNRGEQAGAHFWIGKSYAAQGNQDAANSAYLQASTSDPTGYYSERALDYLEGRQPFTPPEVYDLTFDLEAERAEAEAWMKTVFALPQETDLGDYSPLLSDARFIRGAELWNLGLYEEARAEFESLRLNIQSDPANTYRLANYLIEIGLYRSGITAARQVLNLYGYDDAGTFNAPVYFNHLRFGAYYPEIVFPAAQSYNLDTLFLYSVMRQESLFEGFVTSTAGARGLMQIIPDTGRSIFERNGWPPNYTAEDLYRPLVSITYGADYLNQQRNYFSGDLYTALAAYNGGPGNAAKWEQLAQNDPDLFVEVVRFAETRNYIRSIYELFTIYRNLYEIPQ